MENRCAHCNGTLILSSDRSKWICEYCDSEFAVNSQTNMNSTYGKQDTSSAYCIGSVKVTNEALQKINAYLSANQKLNAIKFVREFSGVGIAEAVAWVDNYQKSKI